MKINTKLIVHFFFYFCRNYNYSLIKLKTQDKTFQNFGKKMLSASFLTPAGTKILVLLSASVKRFGVSRMRDFY